MTNAKPTQGPAFILEDDEVVDGVPCIPIECNETGPNCKMICNVESSIVDGDFIITEEDRANAALIAEAFNVYHETQMTPRQLAERADEQAAEIGELKFLCSNYKSSDEAYQEQIASLTKQRDELLAALEKAVNDYGKPGGPWNVPSEPGMWLHMARTAIANAKGGAS